MTRSGPKGVLSGEPSDHQVSALDEALRRAILPVPCSARSRAGVRRSRDRALPKGGMAKWLRQRIANPSSPVRVRVPPPSLFSWQGAAARGTVLRNRRSRRCQGRFQGSWSVLGIESVGGRGSHGLAGFGASITDTFTDTGRYAKYPLQGLGLCLVLLIQLGHRIDRSFLGNPHVVTLALWSLQQADAGSLAQGRVSTSLSPLLSRC